MTGEVEITAESGVDAAPVAEAHEAHGVVRLDLARVALVTAAAVVAWRLAGLAAPWLLAFGSVVLAIGAWPVLREAVENLLERRMTMELSMTIALVAALASGEVVVALVIGAFVLAAEILEGLAVARGRHAIADLLDYLPRTATVRRGAATREVPFVELRAGDIVLVNPGGSLPVDGTVLAGSSHVDESTITGEPMPIAKGPGDHVYAGTVNQLGALEVRAERIGRDSTFGKIVEAVEHADRSRAPVQKIADRLAGYLVLFAITSAAATFLVTRDAQSTISVVIVAGACGVAAGTPLAILGAIGRGARHGAVIKGGRHVEALWAVDTVVLDKTGTLTFGAPSVRRIQPVEGVTEGELLEAAALPELRSEHPLGRAIVEHARQSGVSIGDTDQFTALPGKGVVASANGREVLAGTRAFLAERGVDAGALGAEEASDASEVAVARGGVLLGRILIGDTLRDEAVAAVRALKAIGVRTVLLTGDRLASASAIAERLGVDEIGAELLPEQKLVRIRALVAEGRRVAMIGDGVNDAPALVEASVGIAMGSGTDVTRESADIVLVGNDLARFVDTLRLARQTRRVILTNFAGTVGVDLLGVGLAALGLLGPVLAAIVHVGSEVAFILNAARLVPPPVRQTRR